MEEKELLLVIDNSDFPIIRDSLRFRAFIGEILTGCPEVKILLTSRISIGSLPDIAEKVLSLEPLMNDATLDLLMRKAKREVSQKEIEELLLN